MGMGRRWGTVGAVCALAFTAVAPSACVRSRGMSSEDKDRLKDYVMEAVPLGAKQIDVNFENKIHLVGYKVEPELAKPGTDVKLTFYWRCDERVEDGWLLFTHLSDEVAARADNLDWTGPLREQKGSKQVLGPDRWEPGKVYADEQTYRMPDWLAGPELAVYVGIWKDSSRLRIVTGPSDGDNRALVLKVKTGLSPKAADRPRVDTPTLSVTRLGPGDKIVVDGKGDEKAWQAAASTGPFVDVMNGKPNPEFPVNGSVKMLWDDANVYVLFDVKDPDVSGGFDPQKKVGDFTATGQPMLWTKHTAEIMVDPDGDGDNVDYYEIQINPQNLVFKSQFDAYNAPKSEPRGPFGHEDWDPKMKSAVVVHGTLDKAGDKDDGYTIEAAIPWAGFTKAAHKPPQPGDTWRMNFYAMMNNGGTAWSPILGQGNFHKSSRFGKVTWVTSAPAAAPSAAPSGSTAALPPGHPRLGAVALPSGAGH